MQVGSKSDYELLWLHKISILCQQITIDLTVYKTEEYFKDPSFNIAYDQMKPK